MQRSHRKHENAKNVQTQTSNRQSTKSFAILGKNAIYHQNIRRETWKTYVSKLNNQSTKHGRINGKAIQTTTVYLNK